MGGYAKLGKTLVFDAQGRNWATIPIIPEMKKWLEQQQKNNTREYNRWYDKQSGGLSSRGYAAYAKDNGYDSVRIDNVWDEGGRYYKGQEKPGTIIATFDPKRIKSAQTITYDDKGEVIPLSKRFNSRVNELRYSFAGENAVLDGDELKQNQWKILQSTNTNDYGRTGIYSKDDILTYDEAIKNFTKPDREGDTYTEYTPDFTVEDAKKALKDGKIMVYSSYPIENSTFVTPSKMEARDYGDGTKVYSKQVNIKDVAWIDIGQGQYVGSKDADNTQDDIRYSFAGEKANLTNDMRKQLEIAKARFSKGDSAEDILKDTGWVLNQNDGKWRYELDDSKAKLSDDFISMIESYKKNGYKTSGDVIFNAWKNGKSKTVSDLFDFDELYKSYPEVANIKVKIKNNNGTTLGTYFGNFNTIEINLRPLRFQAYDTKSIREKYPNMVSPIDEIRSTVLHELQHAIQQKEGFAEGSSTEHERYILGADLREKEKSISRLKNDLSKFDSQFYNISERLYKNGTIGWIDYNELGGMAYGINHEPFGNDDYLADVTEFINNVDGIDKTTKAKMFDIVNQCQELWSQVSKLQEEKEQLEKDYHTNYVEIVKQSEQNYYNSAGEIEARDVQSRGSMTADERRSNVPESTKYNPNAIVRYSPISEFYDMEYNGWINAGMPDGKTIHVGTTSDVLKGIGVADKNIIWKTSKINSSLKKHPDLDSKILRDIPYLLENPKLVVRSKTFNSRIILLGELYNKNGIPVVAVLELSPNGKNGTLDFENIVIASTHSRTKEKNEKSLAPTQTLISNTDIYYVDPNKKITNRWLKLNRLQLPSGLTTYGYIKMIPQNMQNVKGKTAQKSVQTNSQNAQSFTDEHIFTEIDENGDTNDVRWSIRSTDPPTKTGTAYKVFLLKNGVLYPPMVANPNGEGTPVGVWLDADAAPIAGTSKTGRLKVKAGGKGTNKTSSGKLAYRPGWHLGDVPHATQFGRENPETGEKDLFPDNFVWAECEYAMDKDYQDEAMSYGYNKNGTFIHSYAGLPKLPTDGYYRYRTNPRPDTVPWIITGAMKVNRILTDAETDALCRENGVEPMKRYGGKIITENDVAELNKEIQQVQKSTDDTERLSPMSINDAIDKYGKYKPGETPARESNVPKQIDDNSKVSRGVRTFDGKYNL